MVGVGRSALLVIVLGACSAGSSTLVVHGDKPFSHVELFFVEPHAPITDVTKIPHSTPTIAGSISSPASLWIRKYDGADIWDGSATSSIRLGIPNGLGVGTYLGVVASDSTGPIAYGEVTAFRDRDAVTYDIPLAPIHTPTSATPDFSQLRILQWLAPCSDPDTVGPTCAMVATPLQPFMIPGSGEFDVTARIRGVMEPESSGGVGNMFTLEVNHATTILNSSAMAGNGVVPWDFTLTLDVTLPAQIGYSVANTSGYEAANTQNLQIPGVLIAPDPYPGQFAQLDLVDVTRISSNPIAAWPDGAQVWTPHATTQACLRATTAGATNFVVTEGDTDCDGFADATDCAPLVFCDPTTTNGGCRTSCDAQIKDQCLIGTCVDDYVTPSNGACIAATPQSYCVACDSACTYGSLDDRQTTFDCVTARDPDPTSCTYEYTAGTDTICTQGTQVAVGGACVDASILSSDPAFPFAASVKAMNPCVIDLEPTMVATNISVATYSAMVGVERTAGVFDTFVVELAPHAVDTEALCTMSNCTLSSVHDCAQN